MMECKGTCISNYHDKHFKYLTILSTYLNKAEKKENLCFM